GRSRRSTAAGQGPGKNARGVPDRNREAGRNRAHRWHHRRLRIPGETDSVRKPGRLYREAHRKVIHLDACGLPLGLTHHTKLNFMSSPVLIATGPTEGAGGLTWKSVIFTWVEP